LRAMFVAVAWMVGVAGLCLAQSAPVSSVAPSPNAGPYDVVLTRVSSGERVTGRLAALDGRRAEVVTRGGPVAVPWSDVETLARPAGTPLVPPAPPLTMLTTGDVLRVRPVVMTEDRLLATWEDFPDREHLSVPLELVRGVWAPPAKALGGAVVGKSSPLPDFSDVGRWWPRLLDLSAPRDTVWLSNGDLLTGELRGLGEGRYRLLAAGETAETEVPSETLEGWRLSAELSTVPPPPTEGIVVLLIDGSRIEARSVKLSAETLELTMRFDAVLKVSLLDISELRPFGGAVRYLSDIEPAEYRHTPLLRLAWPLVRDRAVNGGPLLPGGHLSSKGLGMHATSEVRYQIASDDREFRVRFGADLTAGKTGSVVGEVLVDGRTVYRSPVMSGDDPAVEVPPVVVKGRATLTLRVLAGPHADIRDRADWADARLVK
jgi:hypothetical protein